MIKRISMGLTEETIARLTLLAENLDTTNKTEAVARAIELALLVTNVIRSGETVHIHDEIGESSREILIPGLK